MEIRVIRNNYRPFRKVVIGEVFLWNNERYMRTETYGGWGFNAVNLFTGELITLNQADNVIIEDNCYLDIE